jgi:hypothetical protein
MATVLGSYGFLPFVKRGIGTQVTRTNDQQLPGPEPRAAAEVTIRFANGRSTTARGLALVGPGEITGFDPGVIARVWPEPDAPNVESNSFPLLELALPDLPWRYTPARAEPSSHLIPWLCLIALKEEADAGELLGYDPVSEDRPGPAVATVGPAAPLPPLGQAWAWAHVQVSGSKAPAPADIAGYLTSERERLVARLLCPRHLAARTRYTVLLVPTFQRGVLAGRGEPVPDSLDGMAFAWPDGPRSDRLQLPVYHRWSFETGEGGDFEALVDKLDKRAAPADVGRRPMDVGTPGLGLPAASSAPLEVEGALRSPSMSSSPWAASERDNWMEELNERLTGQEALLGGTPPATREPALPIYGRWHAGLATFALSVPPSVPWPWVQALNADPRLRVAAGLGSEIVRRQQQQLMAGAWQQVDGIRRVNEELRLAQLAREAAVRVHGRHLSAPDPEAVLLVTGQVHARVTVAGAWPEGNRRTVAEVLRRSRIDRGVLDPQWRRLARAHGPIGRRQGRAPTDPSTLLTRLNNGTLTAAPPPPLPPRLVTATAVGLPLGAIRPDRLATAPTVPGFVPVEYPRGRPLPDPPPDRATGPTGEDGLRTAVEDLAIDLALPVPEPPAPETADLPALHQAVEQALDPRVTVAAGFPGRLAVDVPSGWSPKDELEPVMLAPEFPQPMWLALRDLGQDWILPGLDRVPPNTLSVLVTNQVFVEALMAGLNHEFARELLWNEYPTDRRGTCFRQFWDPSGYVPGAGTTLAPDALHDIKAMTDWPVLGPIGANSPRAADTSGRIVLLVRGDLVRRYPRPILYAAKARWDGTKPAFDPAGEEAHPVFQGTLRPDVAFYGFSLTEAQARGDAADPGWFFVLKERPGEIRFGLDEAAGAPPATIANWQQLTWQHVGAVEDYVNLANAVPTPTDPRGLSWGVGSRSSDVAAITLQVPVRVAVHATRMLPD